MKLFESDNSLLALSDKGKKSISLFSSMVLSLIVGIGISIINTRYLGKEQYGDFKVLINLFSLAVSFLTFGFFYTGGLLLARTDNLQEKRKLTGAVLTLAAFSSLLMILISFVFSLFEQRIFGNSLGPLIRYTLPLLFIFPFQAAFEQILQGSNRIYSLSLLRIGPKLVYIALAFGLQYFSSFNLTTALFAHLSASVVVIGFIIFLIKPRFRGYLGFIRSIRNENRAYGLPIYLGAITGVASTYLAGIMISYYIDNEHVGFYSLAITAGMPLAMLPAAFGITFFKAFVSYARIPARVILITAVLGFTALAAFLIFIDKIVIFLYTDEFSPVIRLSYFIAIGSLFHGFGDFLNRFISAKGLGKKIRNSNFVLGAVNTVGFVLLPRYFGVEGAAYTRLIAGLVYFALLLSFYIQYQRTRARTGQES
jgi:O-antigen/teichoic acid export membrane protein